MTDPLLRGLTATPTNLSVLESLIAEADTEQLQKALNTLVRQGHAEGVRLLLPHIDRSHNLCEAFRWAVTSRHIECARLLIPTPHPHCPRGYLYVEDILLNKNDTPATHKEEFLTLCTQIFDMKDEESRALRSAVSLHTSTRNTRYAVDLLFPHSNVPAALKRLASQRIPSSSEQEVRDTVEYLQSRIERETILQNINIPKDFFTRKI